MKMHMGVQSRANSQRDNTFPFSVMKRQGHRDRPLPVVWELRMGVDQDWHLFYSWLPCPIKGRTWKSRINEGEQWILGWLRSCGYIDAGQVPILMLPLENNWQNSLMLYRPTVFLITLRAVRSCELWTNSQNKLRKTFSSLLSQRGFRG